MIRHKLKYISVFTSLFFVATSCQKDSSILSKEQMVNILHDIQLAESVQQIKYQDFRTRQQKDALTDGIFEKHGVTQAQFDSSLVWYSDNIELFNKVNDSIISTLKKETGVIRTEAFKNVSSSSDVFFFIPNYYYLSKALPTLSFEIDSLNIDSYKNFELEFNALSVKDNTNAEICVSFVYSDTIVEKSQMLAPTIDRYVIKIPLHKKDLKTIFGYIHLYESSNDILLYNMKINSPKENMSKN